MEKVEEPKKKLKERESYKVKEKSVYGDIMNVDRFWEGFSLSLAKK